MSGFAIVAHRSTAPVDPAIVSAVASALTHRGETITSHTVGRAAVLCATTPSTPGSVVEPVQCADGSVLVADVRIDNRTELLYQLPPGAAGPHLGDHVLLAAAYDAWGPMFPARVDGDYSAVVLHPDGRITAITDHLGMRPLYHWVTADWVVIAPEMRQILAHPEVPRRIDVAMAGQYLSGWVESASDTLVQGVGRVPGGSIASIAGGRVYLARHWHPPFDDLIERPSPLDYAAELRELFTDAVRARMRTGGTVACELSGGLDSTSVAATALRLVREGEVSADRVVALSCLHPDSPRADECTHIDAAVGELGIEWVGVRADPDRAPWVDESAAFGSNLPAPPDGPDLQLLGATARASGADVVLSGHFGDDWLSPGHLVLPDLLGAGRLRSAWRRASAGETSPTEALRSLADEGLRPMAPTWVRRPGQIRAPWVCGEARAAAQLDSRRRPGVAQRRFSRHSAQQNWAATVGGYVAQVREYLDRGAQLTGVDHRHPFCDRRLVEFCGRTPTWVLASSSDPRWLQRTALKATLPPSTVARRTKATFSQIWLREVERQLSAVPLADLSVIDRGWVRGDVLASQLSHARHALRGASGAGGIRGIWGVVSTDAAIRAIERGAPSATPPAPPPDLQSASHITRR